MAEDKKTTARGGEIQATIARKTIRAPFSGVRGIRQVNLGQYLGGGDPLVSLQSLDPIYVNFGVPQQEIPQVRVGHRVTVLRGTLSGVALRVQPTREGVLAPGQTGSWE
jgi:membrane fusion protein (multidrug efflux system)